jgi:hypothetical protein
MAETQKKFFRFTNGKGDIDSQIAKKDMKAWTLRDILHAGNLPRMEDRAATSDFFATPYQKDAALVGKSYVFQIQNDGQGLPMSLGLDVRRVLLRAVKRDLANGVLQWRPPVMIGRSMSMSLRNRVAPIESKKRYVQSTFRATPAFHGRAMWDIAKFGVEGLDGKVKIFFGRCLAFFCDAIGDHYIALRWFEASNGDRNVIDPIVLMPRLKEACPTAPASYGIMNVEALLNGALLIPNGDIFFALQSPREKDVYLAQNS